MSISPTSNVQLFQIRKLQKDLFLLLGKDYYFLRQNNIDGRDPLKILIKSTPTGLRIKSMKHDDAITEKLFEKWRNKVFQDFTSPKRRHSLPKALAFPEFVFYNFKKNEQLLKTVIIPPPPHLTFYLLSYLLSKICDTFKFN